MGRGWVEGDVQEGRTGATRLVALPRGSHRPLAPVAPCAAVYGPGCAVDDEALVGYAGPAVS